MNFLGSTKAGINIKRLLKCFNCPERKTQIKKNDVLLKYYSTINVFCKVNKVDQKVLLQKKIPK